MAKDKIRELIEDKGLYDSVKITSADNDLLEKYLTGGEWHDNSIECYCPECQADRVFTFFDAKINKTDGIMRMAFPFQGNDYEEITPEERFHSYQNREYTVSYACALNKSHVMYVILLAKDNKLIKIGQYPSIADNIKPELKKYKSILGEDRFSEFRRAVGLYSCGVGIGSYVYLRRIIEGLVFDRYEEKKDQLQISEEDFAKLRFNEKIAELADFLPAVLVENSTIYGIVSKGVHELSEEECIEMFPYIQDGIELILNQVYEQKQQEEKAKKFRKFVSETTAKLK